MIISKQQEQEIKDTASILDVVGDVVKLKLKGSIHSGLCPFHNEKSPSFTVTPSKNIYKCFGCGVSGDPIEFLKQYHRKTYVEALVHLAGIYNIVLEKGEDTDFVDTKTPKYILNKFISEYYHSHQDQEYIEQRMITQDMVEKFMIGYSPNESLQKVLIDNKYNIDIAKEIGIVKDNDKNYFYNRVMFPIRDIKGNVLGFGGRITTEDKKSPKYINSKESEIYIKGNLVYGLYESQGSIAKNKNALMTEGYTDVISLHQYGFDYSIATGGTSVTTNQIKLIKKYTNQVTLLYDGDQAGIKSLNKTIPILIEFGIIANIVTLPKGHDPDSFLKEFGATELQKLIDNSLNFIEYYYEIFKETKLLTEKQEILDFIKPLIESSPLLKQTFESTFSPYLSIETSTPSHIPPPSLTPNTGEYINYLCSLNLHVNGIFIVTFINSMNHHYIITDEVSEGDNILLNDIQNFLKQISRKYFLDLINNTAKESPNNTATRIELIQEYVTSQRNDYELTFVCTNDCKH